MAFITNKEMIKTRITLFILLLVIPLKSQTHITTDFKDYQFRIFDVNHINNINIIAQHADVNILNWEKDSISVETTIEILSDKPNLSKEMLDEIQINIVTYGKTLQVKTKLSNDFNRTIPYKINYNIFFPKKLSIDVENSYGSVNLSEIEGGVNANIAYCNINIKSIKSSNDSIKNKLNLSYCKGSINHLGFADLHINNSEIKILDTNDLTCISSYSIFSLENMDNYKGSSNMDNIKFGNTRNISFKAENSIVLLRKFSNNAFFELTKGKLTLMNSGVNFNELIINNVDTETSIHLNKLASYTINGEVNNGKFVHPHSKQLQIIKEKYKTSFSGDVGANPNTDTKVIVFNQKKNIEFK